MRPICLALLDRFVRHSFKISLSAALVAADAAFAHAFESGADLYAQFTEGVGVILTYPATLLPLMALGIMLSLWTKEGMVRAWPVFLIGQLVGLIAGAFVGEWILSIMLGLGIVVAALAALLPRFAQPLALGLAGAVGLVSLSASLEGHGLFELPFFIYFGILFGTNIAVACTAGLARYAMERYEADWMRIVWRVAESWIAAILMLILAFTISAG